MTISASSSTADVYTADITLTEADTNWTALTVPATLETWIAGYTDGTDANSLYTYLDILGFDLTDFIADCATSDYCDDVLIEYRYDGLAMVNFVTFGFDYNSTLPTADSSSKLVFCIEEDLQCIGWGFY